VCRRFPVLILAGRDWPLFHKGYLLTALNGFILSDENVSTGKISISIANGILLLVLADHITIARFLWVPERSSAATCNPKRV
jgi:hypothetical protein